MKPIIAKLAIFVAKKVFSGRNIKNSPTTVASAVVALGGSGLTMYQTEHQMWVGLATAILSAILFAIDDHSRKDKAKTG